MAPENFISSLVCADCGGYPLSLAEGGSSALRCDECGGCFPILSGLPCLMGKATEQLASYCRQTAGLRVLLEQALAKLDESLQRYDLLPSTRRRLELLRSGNLKNQKELLELLGDVGIQASDEAPDLRAAAGQLPLTEHYELLFRDWGWNDLEQNSRALKAVLALLGDGAARRIVVFGAGACRLSYDLHQALSPALCIAIDNNPVLLLAAQRILKDGEFGLCEFPFVPSRADLACIEHKLKRPGPEAEHLHLLLADAREPPLLPESVDTVVTPWFIDIVGGDFRELVASIYYLLPVGGVWLNYGPLIHAVQQVPHQRYAIDEVLELVSRGGFDVSRGRSECVPHLQSDSNDHARLDTVHGFRAVKRDPTARISDSDSDSTPSWLLLAHMPVPLTTELTAFLNPKADADPAHVGMAKHPSVRRVIGLIDDQRSVDDIAEIILEEGLVPPSVTPRDACTAILFSVFRACGALPKR